MKKADMLAKAHALQPAIRIGKSGITQGVIAETQKHLKKQKLIKVKFLKSSLEEVKIATQAQHLAEAIGAQIIKTTGFVVIYAKQ